MRPYWIEVTDQSISRVVCTARVTNELLERRVYELIAEHIQTRLKEPDAYAMDLRLRVTAEK